MITPKTKSLLLGIACLVGSIQAWSQNLQSDASIVLSSGVSLVLTDMGISQSGSGEFLGTGAVIVNGTLPVTFSNTGTNDLAFYNLEMANTGGLTLADPIDVTNSLTLTDGIIDANTAPLRFGLTATVIGANNSSHVDGEVIKSGSADFTFPTGDNGLYQPVEILALTGVATFSAQYFDQTHPDPIGPWFDGDDWPISTCDYWSLNQLSGIDSARVGLTYGNNSCNEVNDFNFLRVARYSGGFWEVPTLLGDNPSPGGVATTAPASVFGDFALASDEGFLNVLPIELLSFDANPQGDKVRTDWKTASEINNDYFIVERSQNAIDFSEVGRVEGAGNSNSQLDYQLFDSDPHQGLSYYRLKQVDYDGASSYSDPVAVRFLKESEFSLDQAYSCDGKLCVAYRAVNGPLYLTIRDIAGRLIAEQRIAAEGNFITLPFEAARGIYLVSLSNAVKNESLRFFH